MKAVIGNFTAQALIQQIEMGSTCIELPYHFIEVPNDIFNVGLGFTQKPIKKMEALTSQELIKEFRESVAQDLRDWIGDENYEIIIGEPYDSEEQKIIFGLLHYESEDEIEDEQDYENIDSMAIAEAIANKREDLFSTQAYDRITKELYDAWDEDKSNEITTTRDEPHWEYRRLYVESEINQFPEKWEDVIESFKG